MTMAPRYKVGNVTFLSSDDARAYREFLKKDSPFLNFHKLEYHTSEEADPDDDNAFVGYINKVFCFTGFRHIDQNTDFGGMQFFEDADGCTPCRYPADISDEEIKKVASWWIWYRAHENGGLDHVKPDGTPVWSWYTAVYPSARSWIGYGLNSYTGKVK